MASGSKSDQPLRIGIAGLGTVGGGVVKVFAAHAALLEARAGRPVVIAGVSARNREQDRGIDLAPFTWFDDCRDMATSPDIDVVIELIGGSDGIARELVELALANGKHVVTANKALLAHHGVALATVAEANSVTLAYEAAVAGGIPVIKGLREGLAANRVTRIVAILNGTCNFVLGLMEEQGMSFADAVRKAQDVGFAEADPTTDIGGFDAAHKLAILASIAFSTQVNVSAVDTTGIESIEAQDIKAAAELGYRIKLLGVATNDGGGCSQRVQPALVPLSHPLAFVSGPGNAVRLEADFVGSVEFVGPGAGEGPTASAVVADIADIARRLDVPTFGVRVGELSKPAVSAFDETPAAFYLRMEMADEKGTVAAMSRLLADNDISIETMIQRPAKGHLPGDIMPVIVVTYPANPKALFAAVRAIEGASILARLPHVIRIESL